MFLVRKFRNYQLDSKFEIQTDYNLLAHIRNQKDTHGRSARWFEEF